jgi:hypothetical protein
VKVTRLGATRPLVTLGWLVGGSGGGSGQVPTSNGSNGVAWTDVVQRISANGSDNLMGPFVNFASGSNILLTLDAGPIGSSFPSNTVRIHGQAGSGGISGITSNGSNSLTGAINLQAGVGIALGVSGQSITVTNTGVPGPAGSGGGGGGTVPIVVQVKYGGTAISSLTLDAAPASGHTVLLYCDAFNTADPTAVSSTNTTWTKIKSVSSGALYSMWVGVVAGGAGGTVITITHTNSFLSAFAIEITDTLAGTLGTSGSGAHNTSIVTAAAPTTGHLVAIMGGCDNTAVSNAATATLLSVGFAAGVVWGIVGYATGGKVYALMSSNPGTLMIAEIT